MSDMVCYYTRTGPRNDKLNHTLHPDIFNHVSIYVLNHRCQFHISDQIANSTK